MKTKSLVFAILLTITSSLFAQGTAGQDAKYEYRSLVDLPTAGILEKGFVGITADVLPEGVVMTKLEVGVFDNFSFGISYGGAKIIGSGMVNWYELPGVNLRTRIMDETETTPAVTIGFDSQGKGSYNKAIKRYDIKSPGFFAAAAKNYDFFGYLSLHGVINYSLERNDKDRDLNIGIGIEKTVLSKISVVAEYDFAINDNDDNTRTLGDGKGYLNMGVHWSAGAGFTIGLDLRNMLANKKINSNKADRAIFIEYIKGIF